MAGSLLPPKQNISPLIRFSRWVALISGIVYGAFKYNYLSEQEVEIQKHENEIREQYRIKKAAEKKKLEAEEMAALGREAGVLPRKSF
ncbi:unnamed protein product [Candidula unifasciata]|uniref:ATP synthase F(0) complex subunit e, mitochondrial n=1 Tax=Candidula unifasciata TaxID=100452 RepID=A0A8S3ZA51_9EUPU|nr:unnamed protein product [Candidula unifasciata]